MNEQPKRGCCREETPDKCRKVLMAFIINFSHTLFSRSSYKITLDVPYDQSNDQLGHTYRVEVRSLHQHPTTQQLQENITWQKTDTISEKKKKTTNKSIARGWREEEKYRTKRREQETNLLPVVSYKHVEYRLVICLQSCTYK